MCSCFHGHSSLDLFIVFDAMDRHQRVPDDEAICPCLLCPGVRPLCPHYFVWVSGSSRHATPHFKYFFSFFVSITGPPDLTQSSMGQQVQIRGPWALGHFPLKDQLEHLMCTGHSHDSSPTVSVSQADGTFINKTTSSICVLSCNTQSKNSSEFLLEQPASILILLQPSKYFNVC